MTITDTIDFAKLDGLVPAVVQDATTSRVLMVGFMNADALEATMRSGRVTFFSRSKNRLWTKGESSGHTLDVVDIAVDCDADSLLVSVRPVGPGVCHEGYESCFFRTATDDRWTVTDDRSFSPADVYGGAR